MSIDARTGGERIRVGHDEVVLRVTAAESGGGLLAFDVRLPPGGGPPMMHRHAPAEVYRMLGGELAIYLADERGRVRRRLAGEGDVVSIPGGCEHTVRNESGADALAYAIFAPGAEMESFVRAAGALAAAGPPSIEEAMALSERHGIELTRTIPSLA